MAKSLARIYLDNFEHNIHEIKKIAPQKKICLAIKANAYGHGLVKIAQKAHKLGIDFLSVATVGEGIDLRRAGITEPILLLSLCHKDEVADLIEHSLTPLVADTEFIDILYYEFKKSKRENFAVHLKIDTGMARHGVQQDKALKLAQYIQQRKGLFIEGTCTHFAVSDSVLDDDIAFTKKQLSIFTDVVTLLNEHSIETGILHCAASGGILLHPDAHFDMVRPGILSYGYYPSNELYDYFAEKDAPTFLPVMELVAYVTALKNIEKGESVSYGRKWTASKPTRIATLSIGYGDGYNRKLSNNFSVTINDKQHQLIGRICMDQCVIELNKTIEVKRWDEAILFGPDKNCSSALDIANHLETIPYEILCAVSSRVERVYI